jgi:rare lipoprotein A
MAKRLRAAICGVGIVLLCSSVAMARSEIRSVQSAYGISIVGAASMYNPYRPGYREGGLETASGERYNPSAWAAAIQIDLREKFGGVRQG